MISIQEHVLLTPYTYFKTGGPARFFAEVRSEDELYEALLFMRETHIPFVVLGAGSNVLVSDAGFDGLVIHICFSNLSFNGLHACVGAGVSMAQVAHASLQQNLTGFEWAVGIPGTVGGSIYGNAGCFGGEMKDIIESVHVFDSSSSTNYELQTADCMFAYRESIFKKQKNLIILGASLKLNPLLDAEKKEKQAWIQHMMQERVVEQAIGERTMGSTFKGISLTDDTIHIMQSHDVRFKKNPNSCWIFENRAGKMSAGFLIEQAALKGKTVGGASVSHKHANFLINSGSATTEHVVMLIALIKERVHRKFGIMLEEEIQYIGF